MTLRWLLTITCSPIGLFLIGIVIACVLDETGILKIGKEL